MSGEGARRQAVGWRAVGVAMVALLAAALLAACDAPTHVDGHRIVASAGPGADDAERVRAQHEGAPPWFTDMWDDYLRHVRDGYAVLALEHTGLGGWYVHCATVGCHLIRSPWSRGIRDIDYTRRARELCRTRIAEARLAARPRCALYAMGYNIVWEGPLPWERRAGSPAPGAPAVVGASSDIAGVSKALDWREWWGWGVVRF